MAALPIPPFAAAALAAIVAGGGTDDVNDESFTATDNADGA